MTETGWDEYLQDDASVPAQATEVDTAVTSALDSAEVADSWSDWNAETADDYATSAATNLDAGTTALEQGDYSGAAYDFNQADQQGAVADASAATADDYAATADSYTGVAESTEAYDSYE